MTRGQFSCGPNKLMALPSRPSHKLTLCLFSPKRCNVSLWDFCKPTVQCSIALHFAPPLCNNDRNNAKQASTQAHIPLLEWPYIAPCTVSHLNFHKPDKVLDNPIARHLVHKSSIGTSTHSSPREGHTLHYALTRTSANQLPSPCSTSLGVRNQYRHKPAGASHNEHCQHYHPWVTK